LSSPDRTFADREAGQISHPAPDTDDVAPWELGERADRPPSLPDPQPAPWEQFIRFEPPWELDPPADDESGQAAPPSHLVPTGPAVTQPAFSEPRPTRRAEQPSFPDDPLFAGQPLDDEPTGIGPPDLDTADPYDVHAPLADDLEPLRQARTRLNAGTVSLPSPSPGEGRPSVFGDMFSKPAPARVPVAAQSDMPATPQPDPRDEQHTEPSEPGPFDWPPVPTDFPAAVRSSPEAVDQPEAADQPEAEGQPVADPLSWPPIPEDLPGARDHPHDMQPEPRPEPAEVDEFELPQEPEAGAEAEQADFEAMPWGISSFEREPESEPEMAPWSFSDPEVVDTPWTSTGQPAVPWQQPGLTYEQASGGAQPGPALAPLAAGSGSEQAAHPRVSTMSLAEAPAADRADREGDGDGGLWFLAGQPRDPSPGGAQLDEGEPSSFQTAILTILVALGVIALVILLLALFTSVFD
jgi:hypothetical protein